MDLKKMGEHFKEARTKYNQHGSQSPYDVENIKEIGISNSTIYEIEKGKKKSGPSAEVVIKLAQHYGVSADFLLGLSENPYRIPSTVDELGLSLEAIRGIEMIRYASETNADNAAVKNAFAILDRMLSSAEFLIMLTHACKTEIEASELADRINAIKDNAKNDPLFAQWRLLLQDNEEQFSFKKFQTTECFKGLLDKVCGYEKVEEAKESAFATIEKLQKEGHNGEHSEN